MSSMEYPEDTARRIVVDQVAAERIDGNRGFTAKLVWFSYILGGWKALVITDLRDGYHGGRYYEVTYDRARDKYYLDTYVKESNEVIEAEPQ